MASDGLLFPIFGQISSHSRTPIYSTLIGGIFAALMTLFFDLLTLVEMLSIGTLIAYTQVALAVLISRYETSDGNNNQDLIQTLFGLIAIIILLCSISIHSFEERDYIDVKFFLLFIFLFGLLIFLTDRTFDQRKQNLSEDLGRIFLTPCVPWLPIFSIFCNVYLMLKLRFITWIRFLIWMSLGLSIYIFYGIKQAGQILLPIFI